MYNYSIRKVKKDKTSLIIKKLVKLKIVLDLIHKLMYNIYIGKVKKGKKQWKTKTLTNGK